MKARWLVVAGMIGCFLVACSDDSGTSQGGSPATGGGGSTGDGGSPPEGGAPTGGMPAGGSIGDGGGGGEAMGGAAPFELTSTAYEQDGMIADMYSCNGANVSPPLAWTPGPAGTMSYAIIFRDLSNGLGHASIFDIPAATLSLPEDVDRDYAPADVPGALQCDAYDGDPGYAGPCPGSAHTYQFTIYAVPVTSLGLDEMSVDVDDVEAAASNGALASATLSATYTP